MNNPLPPLNEKGAALIAAVVFVFFLTLFGVAFYQLAETDLPLVSHNEDLMQALYAADSGLERVGWLIRKGDDVTDTTSVNMNPFSPVYDEATALPVANPTSGDFYPSGSGTPYFRIVGLRGQEQGSKVRVRVLGAIDTDGDGDLGLTEGPDENDFRVDPEDINRKIEAYIGLPGSLGNDISAGAGQGFEDPNGTISFESATFSFFGDDIAVLEDDSANPGLILSSSIETGSDVVALPRGLFDESGNLNTGYFADCDKDEFGSPQSFDGATYSGKKIALVTGNVTVSGNWEGKDVTIISTTQVSVTNNLNCGRDGRLIMIAPNIDLNGTGSTKINGIVVAGNDIQLIGDGTRPITSTDDAAVFIGTLLAGGRIFLQQPGWVIVFKEGIINGRMLPLPTLTYDDMEDVDTLNMYLPSSGATVQREEYTFDEITNEEGDSQDFGIFPNPDDGIPDVTKAEYDWCQNVVRLDLVNGVFHDDDIDSIQDVVEGYHDWRGWDRISFWVKLGNWQHSNTTKTATILMTLTDVDDRRARKVINYEHYVMNPTTDRPYEVAEWERISLNFSEFQAPVDFDLSKIKEISFSYSDLEMDLGSSYGRIEWIEAEAKLKYYDPGGMPHDTVPSGNKVMYQTVSGLEDITWYNEINTLMTEMHKDAVAARMAIDRLELLGSATQEYGLPSCFQYDIFRWREMP